MSPSPVGDRLLGVDLARFVAVAGMVLVHARTDIVLPPLEAAAGDVDVAPPSAPAYLELVQAVATNRARLLFLLLAGVGVSLLAVRRGLRTATLLHRAGFLFALGTALLLAGWSDLVLLFYGVLFALAPLLLRVRTRGLLALAGLLALPAVVATALDPARVADTTGVLLVIGEAVPLFCLGLAVGRLDLADRRAVRLVAALGALLSAPGLLVLTVRGGMDVAEVDGPVELLAATTSTAGLCLVVLAGCLLIHCGERRPAAAGRRPVATVLALAGGMPLTAYVGHALLFPAIARNGGFGLGAATTMAAVYLVGIVAFAHLWRRRHRSGPVEAVMRRVSGP